VIEVLLGTVVPWSSDLAKPTSKAFNNSRMERVLRLDRAPKTLSIPGDPEQTNAGIETVTEKRRACRNVEPPAGTRKEASLSSCSKRLTVERRVQLVGFVEEEHRCLPLSTW
jgi:hypothetical protein